MGIFKASLAETIQRTPAIKSFRFIPEKKISFLPGQFLQVIFDEKNLQNQELNKYLSFSCAPDKEYLEVTKRLSDSLFSRGLEALKPNDNFWFKGPMGNCVFRQEYKKIGFLIGGIGITPVISIIEYTTQHKLDNDILLFYSNRNEEEIAFKKELDYWQGINKHLKIVYTVTDCPAKDSQCIFGIIDKELIFKNTGDLKERIFFIFGPPKMVEAMRILCLELGLEPKNIKTESFIGY